MISAAIWDGPRCLWLMSVAVLELRTLGECLANTVGKNVYSHDEEDLNFPLKQDMEELIHSFWLIMLLQIF